MVVAAASLTRLRPPESEDFRLAQAEQVEVGAVEDEDERWRRHASALYDVRDASAKARQVEQDGTVSVRVNGEARRVPAGLSIAGLARELGLEPAKLAVERNLEIVPRSTLDEVKVEDGDAYEIVTFVGGG